MDLFTLTLKNTDYDMEDVLIGVFTTTLLAYHFVTTQGGGADMIFIDIPVLFAQHEDGTETAWEEVLNDMQSKDGGYEVYLIETIKANESILKQECI